MSEPVKKKRELGAALADSMTAEQQSIDERFKRAEALLQEKAPPQANDRSAEASASARAEAAPQRAGKVTPSPHKPEKVVRVTFTMPPHDYQRIADLQQEGLQAALSLNKSEVIRAGLIALQALPAKKRLEILQSVEKIKPGRPAT